MPPMFGNFPYFSSSAYAPSEAPKATENEANMFQPMSEPSITHPSPDPHATPIDVHGGQDNRGTTGLISKKVTGCSRVGRRMIWTLDETIRLVILFLVI